MRILADVLENIQHNIGPFVIISGYRTAELQNQLKASGEPTGSGTKSFHEVGRAVDIYPTSMGIAEYFGRILADNNLRFLFSEISIKPSQNALHLSVNVPGDVRTPKILGLASDNTYKQLSVQEVESYVAKYTSDPQELAVELVEESNGSGVNYLVLFGVAAASALAFLVM
jgi:hypothetical protein